MPKLKALPPKPSQNKLAASLKSLSNVKAQYPGWTSLAVHQLSKEHVLYPQAIYTIQLNDLLAGKSFRATVKKVGWIYFLRDTANRVAYAEVSIISGKHQNVRISEGMFVRTLLRRVERLRENPKIEGRRFFLKSIRVDSLHLFCMWLEVGRKSEYFVPVTNSKTFRAGKWLSCEQFVSGLRAEGERVRAAHMKVKQFMQSHK